jgi:hypothetical protein
MILPDPDLHLGNGDQDPIGYGLVPVPPGETFYLYEAPNAPV